VWLCGGHDMRIMRFSIEFKNYVFSPESFDLDIWPFDISLLFLQLKLVNPHCEYKTPNSCPYFRHILIKNSFTVKLTIENSH